MRGLRPFLDAGQRTVGTHVDVNHGAATPVGMTYASHRPEASIAPGFKRVI